MSDGKKRLGRGLEALLSSTRIQEIEAKVTGDDKQLQPGGIASSNMNRILDLPIDKIHRNPHQPRSHWNEQRILELADSIRVNGLIQPILVRPMGQGYQIIAGERRFKAVQVAGINTIPAIVKDADEQEMIEWALVENIHREDLNAIERAKAYNTIIERFALTQQEAANRLGEERATLANYIRLLDLEADIQAWLVEGKLQMGHARALLGIRESEQRIRVAEKAIAEGLSVRELERWIRALQKKGKTEAKTESKSNHVLDIEREMTRSVGTKVVITPMGRKGTRGKIIIEYYSLDDFDRIREKLESN